MQAASLLSVNRGRELILAAAVFLCTVAEAGVPPPVVVKEGNCLYGVLRHSGVEKRWYMLVWVTRSNRCDQYEVTLYLPNRRHMASLSLLLGTYVELEGRVVYFNHIPVAAWPTAIAEPECYED